MLALVLRGTGAVVLRCELLHIFRESTPVSSDWILDSNV